MFYQVVKLLGYVFKTYGRVFIYSDRVEFCLFYAFNNLLEHSKHQQA